jgi:hypothetical protein
MRLACLRQACRHDSKLLRNALYRNSIPIIQRVLCYRVQGTLPLWPIRGTLRCHAFALLLGPKRTMSLIYKQ